MQPSTTALRWMWIWITIATLVVVVVIGFLFSIANALESIDEGLDTARTAVTGARGDVKPLPEHIQDVNATLGRVDDALKPIPDQADAIVGELGSIRGTLSDVDSTLENTNGLLVDTADILRATEGSLNSTNRTLNGTDKTLADIEGSLNGTTGVLASVDRTLEDAGADLMDIRKLAGRIDRRLELAQEFESLGTNGIFKRVRFLNGNRGVGPDDGAVEGGEINRDGLLFVEEDATATEAALTEVNKHLTSICRQLPPISTPPEC